jgi:energy-coupling factor transport system ATP-binding protein
MALVEIRDVSFWYPQAQTSALSGVSLALERGEFAVLCGKSGCGKTTLLRQLKTALTPHGRREGGLFFSGRPLERISVREQAARIGFVLQNPDNQIVTDKVWHELAFGLESLGVAQPEIRLRVSEMASFFGIQEWYHKKILELSGGQKQLLNLAAVMAMQPELLVLDEPTSQLDPIAASEFLAAVRKVNGELGVTVLLSEHRLEEALPLCDRVIVMEKGGVVADGAPGEVGRMLAASDDPMLYAMPTPMRVALSVEGPTARNVPISVREGRAWLEGLMKALATPVGDGALDVPSPSLGEVGQGDEGCQDNRPDNRPCPSDNPSSLISARDVWFRYEKDGVDVLREFCLNVYEGELLAIVGGNGTGKTTALGVLSGLLRPYRGRLRLAGLDPVKAGREARKQARLVVVPQDPQTLFLHNTILEDLADALPTKLEPEKREERLAWAIEATETAEIVMRHPYDVSGGEQQRVALAMALLAEPRILFLDEPTKGMDAFYKRSFAKILDRLCAEGVTVVVVSHDVEFCAAHATRCALFFDGGVVTQNEPRRFFAGNSFYTTAANRMSRRLLDDVVTTEDLIKAVSCSFPSLSRAEQSREVPDEGKPEGSFSGSSRSSFAPKAEEGES